MTTTARQIIATENITLDGVMQAPGRSDEDTRDGFPYGGWASGFTDHVAMEIMGESMATTSAMLFGRRTYDDMLQFWTTTTQSNPFTEYLTNATKYVVTRNPDADLPYPNTIPLVGEATETVAALKAEGEGNLGVLGSGELVRTLHAAGLVDRFTLQIHPIVLGAGIRLFDDSDRSDLTLERATPTTTGVIIAQYSAISNK